MGVASKYEGRKFNRWLVLSYIPYKDNKKAHALCVCDCGTKRLVQMSSLLEDKSKSCGCLKEENLHGHGCWGTPEWAAWASMRSRCNDPQSKNFKNYGARGISVCKRWGTFENFISDMGNKPSREHSLDRINNDSGYKPSNCRWATRKEQQNNRRIGMGYGPKKSGKYKKCKSCENRFYFSPSMYKKKFCSRKCFYIGREDRNGEYLKCPTCLKETYLTLSRINRGSKYCSRKCGGIARREIA